MKTRRQVRCTLCTPYRWMGNAKGRFKAREEATKRRMRDEAKHMARGNGPPG